jgi:hypothetical protein
MIMQQKTGRIPRSARGDFCARRAKSHIRLRPACAIVGRFQRLAFGTEQRIWAVSAMVFSPDFMLAAPGKLLHRLALESE